MYKRQLEAALVVVVSRRRFPSMVLPPLEGKLKFPEVQDDIRLILLFLPLFIASWAAEKVVILLRAVVVVALAAVINGVDAIVDVIINIARAFLCWNPPQNNLTTREKERETKETERGFQRT